MTEDNIDNLTVAEFKKYLQAKELNILVNLRNLIDEEILKKTYEHGIK